MRRFPTRKKKREAFSEAESYIGTDDAAVAITAANTVALVSPIAVQHCLSVAAKTGTYTLVQWGLMHGGKILLMMMGIAPSLLPSPLSTDPEPAAKLPAGGQQPIPIPLSRRILSPTMPRREGQTIMWDLIQGGKKR